MPDIANIPILTSAQLGQVGSGHAKLSRSRRRTKHETYVPSPSRSRLIIGPTYYGPTPDITAC